MAKTSGGGGRKGAGGGAKTVGGSFGPPSKSDTVVTGVRAGIGGPPAVIPAGTMPYKGTVSVEGKDKYRATHGKAPSGKGLWAFKVGKDIVSYTGNFKNAQAIVSQWAKLRGADRITVQT